ncbi:hypothetical protein C8R45DRAFT_933627 [Mycena sanguinolenta]|nr:hypothetical protein C8R45DRAFT_933627 [Mycena sanguinolenta]
MEGSRQRSLLGQGHLRLYEQLPVDTKSANIVRGNMLIKSGLNVFKGQRERNKGVVVNVLADIVATTGAAIDNFVTFLAKNKHREKTIVDIGVLRYPDIDHPYFKVYRIQLTAWSDTRCVIIAGKDTNGIEGIKSQRKKKAIVRIPPQTWAPITDTLLLNSKKLKTCLHNTIRREFTCRPNQDGAFAS